MSSEIIHLPSIEEGIGGGTMYIGGIAVEFQLHQHGAMVGGYWFVDDLTLPDGLGNAISSNAVAGDVVYDAVGFVSREGVVG